jgi:hypothetical protein
MYERMRLPRPLTALHPSPRPAAGEARFHFSGITTLFGIAPWGALSGKKDLAVVRVRVPFPLGIRRVACTGIAEPRTARSAGRASEEGWDLAIRNRLLNFGPERERVEQQG